MPLYETTFIARQDISAQDAEKLAKEFADIIKKAGGKVVKQEYWGLRSLAYKINKVGKGHYIWLGIEIPGDFVTELERRYRLHEDVVRSLTVKVDALPDKSTPMMKKKEAA